MGTLNEKEWYNSIKATLSCNCNEDTYDSEQITQLLSDIFTV